MPMSDSAAVLDQVDHGHRGGDPDAVGGRTGRHQVGQPVLVAGLPHPPQGEAELRSPAGDALDQRLEPPAGDEHALVEDVDGLAGGSEALLLVMGQVADHRGPGGKLVAVLEEVGDTVRHRRDEGGVADMPGFDGPHPRREEEAPTCAARGTPPRPARGCRRRTSHRGPRPPWPPPAVCASRWPDRGRRARRGPRPEDPGSRRRTSTGGRRRRGPVRGRPAARRWTPWPGRTGTERGWWSPARPAPASDRRWCRRPAPRGRLRPGRRPACGPGDRRPWATA